MTKTEIEFCADSDQPSFIVWYFSINHNPRCRFYRPFHSQSNLKDLTTLRNLKIYKDLDKIHNGKMFFLF